MGRLAHVFELNWTGLNVPRAVVIAAVLVVIVAIVAALGAEQYMQSLGRL